MDEPIAPDAAQMNGTAAVGTAEGSQTGDGAGRGDTATTAGHVALTPSFLAGLATAMRETAIRERDRISGVVAEDAAAHVEKVRARAAIESEELRRLAEEDVEHIEQWSASEIARIQSEAAQRIEDRRTSLDEYLKQHDAIIETEIQGVDGAVKGYEATLDKFFAELSEETEPAAIVRRAGQLPTPPDLDEVRASARASAMAQLAESEANAGIAEAAPTEAVAEAVPEAAEPASADAPSLETVETTAVTESTESGDDRTLPGVMDDGVGSVEPTESTEPTEREVAVAEEGAPGEAETGTETEARPAVAEPVGIMDPDAQRVPSWPAPAPRAEAAPIAPTIDNTSAAVRLLRSVAPWTAPTHASDRAQSDSD
jgi:ribonuclease E